MAGSAAIVIPALKRHTATVIVAHGLGDSGVGWAFLADHWHGRKKFEEVALVLPNAPSIPITINMGLRMPGWYDIRSLDSIEAREDEPGVLRSQAYFHSLIKAEMEKGIPSDRIVIGGFSQGGAMALLSGITCPDRLGGIFGLSCYLLLKDKLRSMIPANNPNKDVPIFMGHGDSDPVVQYAWGQMTADKLTEWGWKVAFNTYPKLTHSASEKELDDLEAYLNERIPPLGDSKTTYTSL